MKTKNNNSGINPNHYKIWMPFFGAVMIVVGMFVEWWLMRPAPLSPAEKKIREIYRLISERYVDEVSVDSLIELTIPSLLNSLDPHTVYISAEEREMADGELESSFSGIGIQFRLINDEIVVQEVIDGGPGEKVGLLDGDVIVKVDDENVSHVGIDEAGVRSRLRGENGSTVVVTVRREGVAEPIEFTITRGNVPVTSIDAAFMLDSTTGYVKISSFKRNTYPEFLNARARLIEEGAEDFVIDLRNNGGGFFEPSILLANEFLPAGATIVTTRGRGGTVVEEYKADGNGASPDARVVVLVDELTASASEVFSGALQDNDRALIIGRRTFGKGLVQEPIDLSDGSEIRLTVQRYYAPSGRCIQKRYELGQSSQYAEEILDRYSSGELMRLDSTKINRDLVFHTVGGREVYGGGGIIPDVFIPNDTAAITSYYVDVARRGLIEKFADEYVNLNRRQLSTAKNVNQLVRLLPSDNILLSSFADYARMNGVPPRWYYLNISAELIVTQLKALIAYDMLGRDAYYMIYSRIDSNVAAALKALRDGRANIPVVTE